MNDNDYSYVEVNSDSEQCDFDVNLYISNEGIFFMVKSM